MSDLFFDLTPLAPPQDAREPALVDGYAQRERTGSVPASFESYVITKVTVPPVRTRLLSRSPQLALLESRVPLTVLVAGAGYGKTTLLSSWAHTRPGQLAWLSLESLENDPLRFWTYVLFALRTAVPSLAEEAWAELATLDITAIPQRLASLLHILASQEKELTLILDDYHVIEEPSIHQALSFLLAHAPACFRLCLASRSEPALKLSRLRAYGQLLEIREAHLRLSVHEAAQFLGQIMGLTLSQSEVQALLLSTEGWIAGLQLAALALRAHADPSHEVARISGSHQYLVEYVHEEILEQVDLPTRTFLQQVSILTQMAPSLCQAVTGEETSAQHLLALERANLFVVPLDTGRRWYRLHPLVREALRAQMQKQKPDLFVRLNRRAAHWYAQQQLFPEAITHAREASDFELAAELIERSVTPQSWHNSYQSVRTVLSRLPETIIHSRPPLCLLAAQAYFMTTPIGAGSLPKVEAYLTHALQGYQRVGNAVGIGGVRALQATLTAFKANFEEGAALAQEALALLPENDVQWRGHALAALGLEALLKGSLARSQAYLQQALACHEASGLLGGKQYFTLMQAEIHMIQGDRVRATHGFRQVLGLAALDPEQAQGQLTDTLGNRRAHFEYAAWYSLAGLLFEENRLEDAEHALQAALVEGQFALIHVLSPGLLLQVRLLCTQDKEAAASALLEHLLSRPQPPGMVREIHFCQAYLALQRGDRVHVASWAAGRSRQDPPLASSRALDEGLLLARWRLSEGEIQAAEYLLASLLKEAQAHGHHHHGLQILVVQALAYWTAGNHAATRQALRSAVNLAAPAGYHRLFLDEGEAMSRLLRKLLPVLREAEQRAYVRALLQATPPVAARRNEDAVNLSPRLMDSLTPQEQRVLRLLARGASNQEIAETLVISLSAVKKHVSHLLSKLEAENRTQAIVRARSLHLLDEEYD